MILDEIVAHKRREVRSQRARMPLADLQARMANAPAPRDFVAALAQPDVSLIAEVKRASPSRGLLCPDFDPLRLATTYAANGAVAISVLTDTHYFQGELAYLREIRRARGEKALPLLRKDFIFDPYQVYEARVAGADALLLIAAVLSDEEMAELLHLARAVGLTALVEVHDAEEIARILPLQPRLVGINNRNLQDFSVDIETFGRLRRHLPADVVAVAESGVHTAADVRRLAELGADAVLVGEALVTAPDVAAKVRELAGATEEGP